MRWIEDNIVDIGEREFENYMVGVKEKIKKFNK
jgi:hypothetical protein